MDKNALYPIYGMVHVPFWQTTTFYVVMILLFVVLLSSGAWYGIKKYRASKKTKLPAWDVALQELFEIEQLVGKGEILGKTFYFRLTWVFKRYLTDLYSFDVYGKTDDELLLYLEGAGLSYDLVQELKVIFEGSSAIKFAQQQAVQDRMRRDLAASVEFVKKTTPADDSTT